MSMEKSQGEESFSSLMLEDIKRRLIRAFQDSSKAAVVQLPTSIENPGKGTTTLAVQEELRRMHVEGAIAWLRVELLEMKSQNRKLARTLLDLSMEIQRLRNETDMTVAIESKTLSTTANPE
uniref:Alanine and arginine rich domain containing protein n=1 Tax=Anolis carolinensis TaxID=28377 RepID=A0A803T1J5_ANOCA|nr:PREDICTED: alanine and arginine-rich domain-containing protein [Anolis carolinensis]XP_008106440.1 PREDICTED: alanine and arginine-rich domain-containing protein [Anolis carolinensis]|eukprot:XP_003219493.1 PREDICTED: alanine and arginine-rich domain-containing protein [Anolis carolinensis]